MRISDWSSDVCSSDLLALLGRRAPTSLKLFLVTVAIVDDMGAVAIIALFYTAQINLVALGGAAAVLAVMALCNRMGLKSLGLYLPLALILDRKSTRLNSSH